PKAVDDDRLTVRIPEVCQEGAVAGLIGVDAAVAEVAHQQSPGQAAKTGWGDRQAPRRIKAAARNQSFLAAVQSRAAVQVEDIDESVTPAGHVVVLVRVLQGERDIELAPEHLHVEGRIAGGDLRVGEGRDRLEVRVIDLHLARAEVGRVEHARAGRVEWEDRSRRTGRDRQALVDGAVGGGRVGRVV